MIKELLELDSNTISVNHYPRLDYIHVTNGKLMVSVDYQCTLSHVMLSKVNMRDSKVLKNLFLPEEEVLDFVKQELKID